MWRNMATGQYPSASSMDEVIPILSGWCSCCFRLRRCVPFVDVGTKSLPHVSLYLLPIVMVIIVYSFIVGFFCRLLMFNFVLILAADGTVLSVCFPSYYLLIEYFGRLIAYLSVAGRELCIQRPGNENTKPAATVMTKELIQSDLIKVNVTIGKSWSNSVESNVI